MSRLTARTGAATCTLVLAALVASCAQIPTAGEVQEGAGSVQVPYDAVQVPAAPTPGDSPEGIVQGFLKAVVTRQYGGQSVVLEYLTPAAQTTWDGSGGVVVYSQMRIEDDAAGLGTAEDSSQQATPGGTAGTDAGTGEEPEPADAAPTNPGAGTASAPSPVPSSTPSAGQTDTVVVQATQVATVDPYGRYKETGEVDYSTTFTLIYTGGQWRIDKLDMSTMISLTEFDRQYHGVSLYYPSSDATQLIPDLRWFPTSRNEANEVAKAQLAGPSPWLAPAVYNPIPAGTELSTVGVTLDNSGTATVSLTGQVRTASAEDRELMGDCISATLEQLSGITNVTFTVGIDPLEVRNQLGALTRNAQAPDRLVYLAGDTLTVLDGAKATVASPATPQPLAGYGPLTDLDASAPAMSLDEKSPAVVLVSHGTTLMTPPLADGTPGTPLYEGTRLVAPSIDRFGWVWTSDSAQPDQLVAVPSGASRPALSLTGKWLAGRQITGIKVSRDGARIAIVSMAGGATTVDVAAIGRDRTGKPVAVGEGLGIGVTVPGAFSPAWADENRVVVLSKADKKPIPTLYELEVGGKSAAMSSIEDGVTLAAGRGMRSLYVGTATGQLMATQATTWEVLTKGSWPAFPG